MSDNDDLEELRKQTDVGTRLDQTDDTEGGALEDAIVEYLKAIEDGERSKTLSVRDERLAAVVFALEDSGEIQELGVALQEALGRDPNPAAIDRSELLRLALRLGIQEADPDVLETARNAYGRHASQQF